MSKAIDKLQAAQARGMSVRPKVGGFPYLAEALRQGGVTRNQWILPACQSLYVTEDGPVVSTGTPLASGTSDVPPFDREGVVKALRENQAGRSTFPQFLESAWRAGVVRYDADFLARHVTYFGALGEEYVEEYQSVDLP
jgi:uncharacterized protein YbcV (DUF1398 family)